jgi:hypothetical protein
VILWLRLAAATVVVLVPGLLLARAFGQRGAAAAFAWSCAVVAGALAITFAVGGSLWLTLGLDLGAGALALAYRGRQEDASRPPGRGLVALGGIVLGALLWGIQGVVHGDGIFHLGRVRKLDDFGSLSLRAVDEFKNGGLHPGYAFPLWHGWLALVAKVAQVDPASVVQHESSLLTPLALVLAYEMGRAVFGNAWLGLATMAAQVAVTVFAPGDGGQYTSLDLPATAARQLLVPAVIALFFGLVRRPSWALAATLGAAGTDLAFVHPTYALFLAIPLVGFAAARALLARADVRRSIAALAAMGVPMLLVYAWLAPIVSETRSHNPSAVERAIQLRHYASDLVVTSDASFHLAPGIVARTGAVAVAALALVPLAGLASRRRWSALVIGGSVLVLGIELWSLLFPRFSDLVSLSQSRRAAGFVPFAFAVAGGAVVLRRMLGWLLLPVALAAGIVLQAEYPGTDRLGPSAIAWVALVGGLVALAFGVAGRLQVERPGPIAAAAVALFCLPVVVHGFSHWSTAAKSDPDALPTALVAYLRTHVPERAVVFADLETSYRISGYVPVYVCDAPPAHVADTNANHPYRRRAEWLSFLRTGSLAVPRGCGAQWLVLRRGEQPARVQAQGARPVYRDASFTVFRL